MLAFSIWMCKKNMTFMTLGCPSYYHFILCLHAFYFIEWRSQFIYIYNLFRKDHNLFYLSPPEEDKTKSKPVAFFYSMACLRIKCNINYPILANNYAVLANNYDTSANNYSILANNNDASANNFPFFLMVKQFWRVCTQLSHRSKQLSHFY